MSRGSRSIWSALSTWTWMAARQSRTSFESCSLVAPVRSRAGFLAAASALLMSLAQSWRIPDRASMVSRGLDVPFVVALAARSSRSCSSMARVARDDSSRTFPTAVHARASSLPVFLSLLAQIMLPSTMPKAFLKASKSIHALQVRRRYLCRYSGFALVSCGGRNAGVGWSCSRLEGYRACRASPDRADHRWPRLPCRPPSRAENPHRDHGIHAGRHGARTRSAGGLDRPSPRRVSP